VKHWLLFLLLPLLAAQPEAGLAQVQSVYFLPMSAGLDQHLANQMRKLGRFQIVSDPSLADAVFTDKVGEMLEQRLRDLEGSEAAVSKDQQVRSAEAAGVPVAGGAGNRSSTWSRGRGTLFLVDRKSRRVLWSTFERPSFATPQELDRMATRITERLKNSYGK
jgi:hypothetical protein